MDGTGQRVDCQFQSLQQGPAKPQECQAPGRSSAAPVHVCWPLQPPCCCTAGSLRGPHGHRSSFADRPATRDKHHWQWVTPYGMRERACDHSSTTQHTPPSARCTTTACAARSPLPPGAEYSLNVEPIVGGVVLRRLSQHVQSTDMLVCLIRPSTLCEV
jgi:hypothetical protein